MKIFISWSGELSRNIAEMLSNWIPTVIQSTTVFCSSLDIEKGENWNAKLTSQLNESNFGIVCLTEENLNAPWIHFEAGALAKHFESRVSALVINVDIANIKGPLSTFQATKFTKKDLFELIKTINENAEYKVQDKNLETIYESLWPQIELKFNEIIKNKKPYEVEKKSKFNINEAIDEILQLTRVQSAILSNPDRLLPLDYLDNILIDKNRTRTLMYNDEFYNELFFFTKRLLDTLIESKVQFSIIDEIYFFIERFIKNDRKWMSRFKQLFVNSTKFTKIEEKAIG